MSTCTDQKQNHTFRIFLPDKKEIIHYMAFIAILVIATKLMGFMLFMDSGKSCLRQFFNKAFKDFKILLGTLFQQFQVFFELPGIGL
jgi:NADH:ubiquinone oxidoreductase subunit 6 (subunit J)